MTSPATSWRSSLFDAAPPRSTRVEDVDAGLLRLELVPVGVAGVAVIVGTGVVRYFAMSGVRDVDDEMQSAALCARRKSRNSLEQMKSAVLYACFQQSKIVALYARFKQQTQNAT